MFFHMLVIAEEIIRLCHKGRVFVQVTGAKRVPPPFAGSPKADGRAFWQNLRSRRGVPLLRAFLHHFVSIDPFHSPLRYVILIKCRFVGKTDPVVGKAVSKAIGKVVGKADINP